MSVLFKLSSDQETGVIFSLLFRWRDLSHVAISNIQRGWEIWPHVTRDNLVIMKGKNIATYFEELLVASTTQFKELKTVFSHSLGICGLSLSACYTWGTFVSQLVGEPWSSTPSIYPWC